ncbi:MAG: ArsA family ATPase [Candidatus Heimdallarchaeota archaeon]|nr:ArsA family ATPase [Candidatus Heimdallarchaeota archaeon]
MVIENLIENKNRRFIIVGGKGGVGKTSISASIAVALASRGQKTLIISTDPAHSLSDSLDQDISGGDIIKINMIDNLYGMEINPQEGTADLKAMAGMEEDTKVVDDLVSGLNTMGIGFEDFSGLMDTLPPGVDEAIALSKVIQIIDHKEYQDFERIIFDTAPTGHTLRMLSLPEFLDSFMGKLIKLRVKMSNFGNAIKSLFGGPVEKDNSLELMEKLKGNIVKVKDLFRNEQSTEFMIASIPTIMAINESIRLSEALKIEQIKVKEVLINQILPENTECKFCSVRSKGQQDNLKFIREQFSEYNITEIPFFDTEIRGFEGLTLMGNTILA